MDVKKLKGEIAPYVDSIRSCGMYDPTEFLAFVDPLVVDKLIDVIEMYEALFNNSAKSNKTSLYESLLKEAAIHLDEHAREYSHPGQHDLIARIHESLK